MGVGTLAFRRTMVSSAAWDGSMPLVAADAFGRESPCPLHVIKPFLECEVGPFLYEYDRWKATSLLRLTLARVVGDEEKTQLWVHDRQVYVVGPRAAALAPLLSPHEVVNANPLVAVFREDLEVRNAFSDASFTKLLADAAKFGLDLTGAYQEHREKLDREPFPCVVPPRDFHREALARDMLRDVAERAWHLDDRAPRTMPLWFRRAATAPLVLMKSAASRISLEASLGAGRVMRVRLLRFPGTAATPLHVTTDGDFQLDGGDCRLWVTRTYDQMLEAEGVGSVRRRREARQDEDEADDD